MPDIVVKDRDGHPVTHEGITGIGIYLTDGTREVFGLGGTGSVKLYTPRLEFSQTTKEMTIPFAAPGLFACISVNGDQVLTVYAPEDTDTATVSLAEILKNYLSCTISVVLKGPGFVDSDPVDIWYMPAYVEIDIAHNSMKNVGTAGTSYNAKISSGSLSNGQYSTNSTGGMTIPADFMAGADPWTVAFTIDSYTTSSAAYSRFARGDKDVPSLFYSFSAKANMFKLTSSTVFPSTASWYDTTTVKPWGTSAGNALSVEVPTDRKTVIAFRNTGEYIEMWINGEKKVTQAAGSYTSTYRASSFTVGNVANNSYNMLSLKCSMLKAWTRALTDEEMTKVAY